MLNEYDQTINLINAVMHGKYQDALDAIQQGANVNCRVIKTDEGYRVARKDDLSRTIKKSCPDMLPNENVRYNVDYEVPMAGTTTLLNILAINNASQMKTNNLELAKLLMNSGAELGAIDYASYWESWGDYPENYFQNTPLLNAIAAKNLAFSDLYLDFLSKLSKEKQKEILDYKDKFKAGFHTALEFAVRRGFSKLATTIVRAGADPNPQPFIYAYAGQSPLHMACMSLGQAWNTKTKEWHPHLGSDLELILALLEHEADFNITANTEMFDGFYSNSVPKWKHIFLGAFDHIDINLSSLTQHEFDVLETCQQPALKPKKKGQVKHPFHEEESFRSNLTSYQARSIYLKSEEFLQRDKIILQKTILKRIIKDFNRQFIEDPRVETNVDVNDVQSTIDIFLNHKKCDWFYEQLEYGGIFYNASKPPKLRPELPIERNPIFTLSARNKITHCMINDYAFLFDSDAGLTYNRHMTISQETDKLLSTSQSPKDSVRKEPNEKATTPQSHSAKQRENVMPCSLVHLDVDQTLLNQRDMNDTLLDMGITKVYLFTNEEGQTPITATFLLQALAHPATKVMAALCIITGIIVILCSCIGLVGIGLNLISLAALIGLGACFSVVYASLSIAGFFASSKSRPEHIVQDQQAESTYLTSVRHFIFNK